MHTLDATARRSGAVIVGVIIALVIVDVIIVAYVLNARRDQHLGVDRLTGTRSFYAAEAGLNMAIREVALDEDIDGDGGIGSISDDGNANNDPAVNQARTWVNGTFLGEEAILVGRGHSIEARRALDLTFVANRTEWELGPDSGLVEDRFVDVGEVNYLDEINWNRHPVDSVITAEIDYPRVGGTEEAWPDGPVDDWARRFTGTILIPDSGDWTFYVESDDGARLIIDGEVIVDNDGRHDIRFRSDTRYYERGVYTIEFYWFDYRELHACILAWEGPGYSKPWTIPPYVFKH